MEESDNQSGAIIGSNDDLLTEILIRLPVTSILRFKSVSKHWRLLLSHQHFTHRYDINNNNNLSKSVGLFGQSIYVPFDVETRSPPPVNINNTLDFYFNRSHVKIEQSCNGLLLCSAFHKCALEYYVFNPTTKQLVIIPSLPKNIKTMALAYHQIECVHYKVVCVCYLESGESLHQIQVYSSDTMKWKICIESFYADTSEFHHSVYWNGAVHWAPTFQIGFDFLYFILDVEQLQKLPVPEESEYAYDDDDVFTMYFGESRDHLHFISQTNSEDRIMNVNVYEMLRDRSGWFVKYRVQFNELPAFSEMFGYDSGVVDVVRGKEEEDTFLVLVTGYPMQLMRYNVRDKSFNPIYTPPKTNDDDDFYDDDSIHDFYAQTSSCFRYIEALSSF